MKTNAEYVEEVKVTPKELELLLYVRSKFKGCECCVEKLIEIVGSLEKKDGK